MVSLNHQSYSRTIGALTSQFLAVPAVSFERMNGMIVQINCELLNFLSTVRTFVDHAETALKREFGTEAQQISDFKNAASREFDGSFSYRFLSQLRNYTQHCGLPLGKLQLNASAASTTSESPAGRLEAFFLRDHLLTNFDGWKMVKNELAQMPELIPVEPHLKAVVASVERIEDTLVRIQSSDLERHLTHLESLAKEVEHLPGSPCVYTAITPIPGGANTDYQRLHLDFLRSLRDLLAKNRNGK
jgi:hypothetical protein